MYFYKPKYLVSLCDTFDYFWRTCIFLFLDDLQLSSLHVLHIDDDDDDDDDDDYDDNYRWLWSIMDSQFHDFDNNDDVPVLWFWYQWYDEDKYDDA